MMLKLHSRGGGQQLAEERRTLAERYTIDAEEAQRREELAAETAEQERAVELTQEPAPQPVFALAPEPPEPALAPVDVATTEETTEAESAANAELPIYRWLDGR